MFGMGTGVAPPLETPGYLGSISIYFPTALLAGESQKTIEIKAATATNIKTKRYGVDRCNDITAVA